MSSLLPRYECEVARGPYPAGTYGYAEPTTVYVHAATPEAAIERAIELAWLGDLDEAKVSIVTVYDED